MIFIPYVTLNIHLCCTKYLHQPVERIEGNEYENKFPVSQILHLSFSQRNDHSRNEKDLTEDTKVSLCSNRHSRFLSFEKQNCTGIILDSSDKSLKCYCLKHLFREKERKKKTIQNFQRLERSNLQLATIWSNINLLRLLQNLSLHPHQAT